MLYPISPTSRASESKKKLWTLGNGIRRAFANKIMTRKVGNFCCARSREANLIIVSSTGSKVSHVCVERECVWIYTYVHNVHACVCSRSRLLRGSTFRIIQIGSFSQMIFESTVRKWLSLPGFLQKPISTPAEFGETKHSIADTPVNWTWLWHYGLLAFSV